MIDTKELLKALATGHGGIQIDVSETIVTVSTRYFPRVTVQRTSFDEAIVATALAVVQQMFCPMVIRDAILKVCCD